MRAPMRKTCIALVAFAATAHADDLTNTKQALADAWYRDSETQAWLLADTASDGMNPAPCSRDLVKLKNLGVPDDQLVPLRQQCDAIEYHGRIKEVERWIVLAAESDSVNNRDVFAHCRAAYDAAMARGNKPIDRVPERRIRIGHDLVMWSGALSDLKQKYCDAPMKKVEAELDERTAPYRKVLHNDKLAMVLGFNATATYVLPGGDASMNPAKLAASPVWFDSTSAPSSEEQKCADGRRRTLVRKYEFDKQQRLVKTSTKEYCGAAVYK
jgi:hypothetical protein